MKFKEITDRYISYKKDYVRPSTLSLYNTILKNHLIPYFGEHEEITQEDTDKYLILKSTQGYARKGLQSHITALKSMLSWANKKNVFCTSRFMARYPTESKESKEITPLSVHESRLFAKYCEENFDFQNLILYTCLFSGLRAGELCGLKWEDINVQSGSLSVNKIAYRVNVTLTKENSASVTEVMIGVPKTPSSIRDVPLSKQLLFFYKPLNKIVNPNFFIASNSIKPVEPKILRTALDKILAACGIQHIRLHDLRHTFATRCISAGIDSKTVSELLGHSSVVTTLKLYMHTDDDSKKAAVNKLNKKMKW